MGVYRSCFYNWLNPEETFRQKENAKLREKVAEIHAKSRGTYGRRRIATRLDPEDITASPGRVGRRMKELNIEGISPRSFVKTTRPDNKLKNSPFFRVFFFFFFFLGNLRI